MGSTDCEGSDDYDDEPDDQCLHCRGDGRDPWNDYLLPCPYCCVGDDAQQQSA